MRPSALGEGPLRVIALIGVVFVTATLARLILTGRDEPRAEPVARATAIERDAAAAVPAAAKAAVPRLARVATPAPRVPRRRHARAATRAPGATPAAPAAVTPTPAAATSPPAAATTAPPVAATAPPVTTPAPRVTTPAPPSQPSHGRRPSHGPTFDSSG